MRISSRLERKRDADCDKVVNDEDFMIAGSAARQVNRDVRSTASKLTILAVVTSVEQAELRRIARRLGEAEVAEGMRGEQAPARRPLQEAALDQVRLDDVLYRVAR